MKKFKIIKNKFDLSLLEYEMNALAEQGYELDRLDMPNTKDGIMIVAVMSKEEEEEKENEENKVG